MIEREDDGKKGRFVLLENGIEAGEMTYTWAGESKFIIDHTGVNSGFEGKGIAKQLVAAGVEFARENKLKIIPLCTFAKSQFDKIPSYADVHF